VLLGACACLFASGCGSSRQDTHEVKGVFSVKVLDASFPAKQAMARPSRLKLQVRNIGAHTVPNVAVTIDSFSYTSNYPELAAAKRPVWVIEEGPGTPAKIPVQSQAVSPPGGGQTAYVNTWALGPLAPHKTQTFVWRVVAVKAGSYTVHYTVAAGLAGKAHAQLTGGATPTGHFTVGIAPRPPATHVNPQTGRVVPGASPPTP
jgi:hypothetical protein